MGASESSRPEAKYQGERALFLLLMTTARTLDPAGLSEPSHPAATRQTWPKRDRDLGDTESRPPGL